MTAKVAPQSVSNYDRPSTGALVLLVTAVAYALGWLLTGLFDWMSFTLAMPWLLIHIAIWMMMLITFFYIINDDREEPYGVHVMTWVMLAVTLLLFFTSLTPVQSFVDDTVSNDGMTGTVNPEGATALNLDCTELEITNGTYPSRVANLVFPASGPSMLGLDAEELFEQICNRMSVSEVQRAFYPGGLVPVQTLYSDSLSPTMLNKWPPALAEDDVLSGLVLDRLALVAFDAEWVSQEALGGESYKILTILPAAEEVRPVIATVANFRMPTGGMNLWKLTPVSYGDSPLDEVSAAFFEPSLGIFFIPSGVELGVAELENEVDLGDFFGDEEEVEGEAAAETTTSVAPDGTVTTVTETPEGTVTTTVTAPDGSSSTTVTTPDGSSSTTTTPGGGGGTSTTLPGGGGGTTSTTTPGGGGGTTSTTTPGGGGGTTTTTCPGCGTTTTTKPPTTTTTTTQPPTTTTTTTKPPTTTTTTTQPPTTTTTTTQPPTTTTTTTQPPTTTTTTQPAVQPDFKPFLSGSTSPWTFQLQIGNPADWCGFVSQNGKSLTPGSTKVYVSDLYVHDNGDKWLFVTGTPCNGTPKKTLKTNTVIWGY